MFSSRGLDSVARMQGSTCPIIVLCCSAVLKPSHISLGGSGYLLELWGNIIQLLMHHLGLARVLCKAALYPAMLAVTYYYQGSGS